MIILLRLGEYTNLTLMTGLMSPACPEFRRSMGIVKAIIISGVEEEVMVIRADG
jgi:hypothetical protein